MDACLEDARYAQGRKEVREETWAYYGEGAVRSADYIMEKYTQLTSKEKRETNVTV